MICSKAIVRPPGKNFFKGITNSGLGKPDYSKALGQHLKYCDALNRCGIELIVLDADERYPDGCFVEDTAVVTSEVAVITRPGAPSRSGEEIEVSKVLSRYRTIERILPPGTLDGGDVLRVENHFYIGISGRTNQAGAKQLSAILSGYGYTSSFITVKDGLHLKSVIAYLGNGNFVSVGALSKISEAGKYIILDHDENYSANCLNVNGTILIPDGFPASAMKIESLGQHVIRLDMSEFRKMDGGLTCLSLLL